MAGAERRAEDDLEDYNFTHESYSEDFTGGLGLWTNQRPYNYPDTDMTGITTGANGLVFDETYNDAYGNMALLTADCKGDNFNSGLAFGGGAYVEFDIRYAMADVDTLAERQAYGWPACWALPVEGMARMNDLLQWPGQADMYHRQVEWDFFEAIANLGIRWCTMILHEHFGIYGVTCGAYKYCSVDSNGGRKYPPETFFYEFHKHSSFWKPATDTEPGFVRFYIDGRQAGSTIYWNKLDGTETPPSVIGSTAFNIMDKQHFGLIVGPQRQHKFEIRKITVIQDQGLMDNWTA